jgi:hypothetical protein
MKCGSLDVVEIGVETRRPEQNEELLRMIALERSKYQRRHLSMQSPSVPGSTPKAKELVEGNLGDDMFKIIIPWYSGKHLCPKCLSFGITFSDVNRFID